MENIVRIEQELSEIYERKFVPFFLDRVYIQFVEITKIKIERLIVLRDNYRILYEAVTSFTRP